LLDFTEANSADFTLSLSQNVGGLQLFQNVGFDLVNTQSRLQQIRNPIVNFRTGAFGIKFGLGADGQILDF
jgi:hypothetical protein